MHHEAYNQKMLLHLYVFHFNKGQSKKTFLDLLGNFCARSAEYVDHDRSHNEG